MVSDSIKRINQDIASSGLPLEIETSSLLNKDGWTVRYQVNYIDQDTDKERPIDLIAVKSFSETYRNHTRLNFNLVIECKRDEKPWVFFSIPKETEPFTRMLKQIVYYNHFAKPEIKDMDTLNFESHYSKMSDEKAVIHYEPFKGKNNKERIPEAKYQVVKCLLAQLEEAKKWHNSPAVKLLSLKPVLLYLAVIVFDGELYSLKFENNELVPHPTEYLQYEFVHSGKFFLIDIVTKAYFSQYLKLIDKEIEAIRTNLK